MGVAGSRVTIVSEPKRPSGREVWESECARGCGAKHETTETAVMKLRIEDTKPPVVERPGLTEAGTNEDPVLPSSTANASAGTSCSELQEASPQEEMASASPRGQRKEPPVP